MMKSLDVCQTDALRSRCETLPLMSEPREAASQTFLCDLGHKSYIETAAATLIYKPDNQRKTL